MTLDDMKANLAAATLIGTISIALTGVHAQAPTGSLGAMTKAVSSVRSARAAALAGKTLTTGTGNALGKSTQQIMGYLWTSQNGAITEATVQIRDTVTGAITDVMKTGANGEFIFQNVTPGEYVIEYISDSAKKVLTIGNPFTVSPGETVATFVRLSNGATMLLPNELSALSGNVAGQAVTSAASEGVTSIATPLVSVVPPVIPPPTTTGGNTPAPTTPPPTVVSAIR